MGSIKVIGYTTEYPFINLELKNNEEMYDMAILVLHIEEFKKGMKISKIYKTYKKGTKVKYVSIDSEEDALEYYEKIKAMIEEYNAKYKTEYII